jgi:hypothetical protein
MRALLGGRDFDVSICCGPRLSAREAINLERENISRFGLAID